MVTKKTFEAVAAALYANLPKEAPEERRALGYVRWGDVVDSIADVFAADNPRFDRARFYRACGVETK